MGKVLVALSGGMDSATAVIKLRCDGYDPVGLYIDMLGDKQSYNKVESVAHKLGIELITEECCDLFRTKIIDPFTDSYLRGETPAPCSLCNALIKWDVVAQVADRLCIEKIATGHYCRMVTHNGKRYISRATDPVKDQSYYLWGLNSKILDRALFPLGDSIKQDNRKLLKEVGYDDIESQRESMSICFLGNLHYEEFITRQAEDQGRIIVGGEIRDVSGNVVGRHRGLPFYTVGQKRGISGGLSVLSLNPADNSITVGREEELYVERLLIRDWTARDVDELTSAKEVCVMVRGIGRNPSGYASVSIEGDYLHVTLTNPAWAVASGQPAVFYIADRVIGGGIIEVR